MVVSYKKLNAIKLLLEGHTQKEVAEMLHVHRNTITLWRKDAEFQQAYKEYRDKVYEQIN